MIVVTTKGNEPAGTRASAAPPPAAVPQFVAMFMQPQYTEIALGSLRNPSYELAAPITVRVAAEKGKAVVRWDDGGITAEADSLGLALQRLQTLIVERANDPAIVAYLKSRAA